MRPRAARAASRRRRSPVSTPIGRFRSSHTPVVGAGRASSTPPDPPSGNARIPSGGGLHGLRALGSVSERVAHRAACSVLVVRSPAPSA
ncbi:MAG: universal stress protein [Pseudomonadota bacterium]